MVNPVLTAGTVPLDLTRVRPFSSGLLLLYYRPLPEHLRGRSRLARGPGGRRTSLRRAPGRPAPGGWRWC